MFSHLIRFLIAIVLLSSPVAAESIDKDNFEVDFNYGFNKFYIEASEVTAKVTVANKHEDLEGSLELLVNVSSNEDKKVYSSYSEDLFLSKGSDKTIDINFFPSQDKVLTLRILDKSGQVVWSDDIELEDANSSSDVNIAVLSNDFDKFTSLNSIPIWQVSDTNKVGDDTPYTSLANLSDSFPTDKHLLKSLDMIIIDDYNAEALSDSQLNALNGWVSDGGTLLIASEVGFQKILNGLSTLTGDRYGDGNVLILPFNLSGESKDTILDLVHKYVDLDASDNLGVYEELNDFINYIPNHAESSIDFTRVLFVFLMFLLIFVSHFILKEINKLDMLWIAMPLASLLFIGFMYVSDSTSSLENSLVSSVTVSQLSSDNDYASTSSIISLISPNGKDVSISSDQTQHIYMYALNKSGRFDSYDDSDIVIYNSLRFGRESEIRFKNSNSFKNSFLKSYEDTVIDIKTVDIKIDSENITGKVVNNSDLDLIDLVLLYGDSYFHIGSLDRKSSKDLNFKIKNGEDFIFGNEKAGQIYPIDTSSNSNDFLDNITKSKILNHELDNYSSNNDIDLTLIAWSKDSLIKDLKVNDNSVARVDRNLIFIPFGDYVSRDNFDIPFGVFKAEVTEYPGMNIATYKPKRFNGNGHVVYSLIPWRSVNMDKFSFEEVDVSLQKEVSEGKVTPYLYNYSTLKWDKQDETSLRVDASNKDIYYDDEYGVKISLEPSDHKVLIEEPLVSVKFTKK